ncbi:HAMP domain-containing histidine kinase [Candidatus Daviesbacteria bacterium]|nr:HAMP domain-containing histidine kinase [Candidatus Daviesbacteria bacterium]
MRQERLQERLILEDGQTEATRPDINFQAFGLLERLTYLAYNNVSSPIAIVRREGNTLEFANQALCDLEAEAQANIINAVTQTITDSTGRKTLSLVEASRLNTDVVYQTTIPTTPDSWHRVMVSSEKGLNGQITGKTMVTAFDITEDKLEAIRKQEELDALRDTLVGLLTGQAEYEQKLRRDMAVFAHDLKTPLTYIKGTAQIIQRQESPTLSPTAQTRLGAIAAKVDSMTSFINDSIDYANAGSELKLEPLSIASILQNVYEQNQDIMEHAGIKGRISLPQEDLTTTADSAKVAIALRILLSNAMQATEGSEIKEVAIIGEDDGKDIIIYVADTGTGVPQGDEESSFEGKTTKLGGTGFGLKTARKIARRLGGDVYLVHTVDAQTLREHPEYKHTGSIFALRLPLNSGILSE